MAFLRRFLVSENVSPQARPTSVTKDPGDITTVEIAAIAGEVDPKEQWSKEMRAAIEFEEDPHKAALEDDPEIVYVGQRTWAAIFALSLGLGAPCGLSFLGLASVSEMVTHELGAPELAPWVVGTWSIANACSALVAGNLSDTFGRRNIILLGNFIVLVGAVLGGTTRSIEILLTAQTLIGFGGGFVFDAFAAGPEMLPNKWKALGAAIVEAGINIPWATVSVVLANAVARYASWRWIYYICIMQSFVAFKATALLYWPVSRPRGDFDKNRWQQIKDLDYIGIFSITGGLILLTSGLTWGGNTFPWDSVGSILPILLGLVSIIGGLAYDFTLARNPMMPLSLFWPHRFRPYVAILVVLFVSGMNFHAMSALLPMGTALMFTTDGTVKGIMSLPNTIMQLVAGVIFPLFAHKVPCYIPWLTIKWQLVFGMFCQALFLGFSARAVNPNNQYAYAFLPGFGVPGFTWVTILSYAITALHVPHSQLGTAIGFLATFRSTGGAVGNALFGTLFNRLAERNTLRAVRDACQRLDLCPNATAVDALLAETIAYNMGGGATATINGNNGTLAGVAPAVRDVLQAALRGAYGEAMQVIFLATIPLSVMALVCSLWIEDPTPYMNNHVQFRMYEKGGFGKKRDPKAPALTGAVVLWSARRRFADPPDDIGTELGRVNSQQSHKILTV